MMYMATAVQQYKDKPADANWDAMEAFNKLSTCFANSKIYDMIVNSLQADPNERTATSALASNDVFEGRLWETMKVSIWGNPPDLRRKHSMAN